MQALNNEKIRKKNRQKKNFKFFRKWHRRIGIFFSLLILYITISGMILNHSDDLNLSKKYIGSNFLLNLYQIKAAQSIHSFTLSSHKLSSIDNQFWFDDKLINNNSQTLQSAIYFQHIYFSLFSDELWLLNKDGLLIDTMTHDNGLPQNVEKLGIFKHHLYLKTSDEIYVLDEAFTSWQAVTFEVLPKWSQLSHLSDTEIAHYQQRYRSNIIAWQRFIQDLHSGRILTRFSKIFLDLIGMGLLLLSLTGLFMWLRMRKK